MIKIEEYPDTTFGESQEPKPKNWRRKTFECSCNIGISHNKEDLGRIDIKYIVKSKHEEIVMQGGYNKPRWWSRAKPNNWKITHIEQKFGNIKHTIHMGYIERGGALTPTPLFVEIKDIDKYKSMILREKRRKKLKQLTK